MVGRYAGTISPSTMAMFFGSNDRKNIAMTVDENVHNLLPFTVQLFFQWGHVFRHSRCNLDHTWNNRLATEKMHT